jgi:poly-gamma-glutamate synthesis protein (capsule biosynthesis protein)
MKRTINTLIITLLFAAFLLASCAPQSGDTGTASNTSIFSKATATPTQEPQVLWVDPAVPSGLASSLMAQSKVQSTPARESASIFFDVAASNGLENIAVGSVEIVYALEAPFPTVTDELTLDQLQRFWRGDEMGDFPFDLLQLSSETKAVFTNLWGEAAIGRVSEVSEATFATNDFTQMRTWAIVPFEQITPRWKVIKVDGISPLDKPMDVEIYPLTVAFTMSVNHESETLKSAALSLLAMLPATNRDETKMTVLMMTGTTAMVRAIAYKMEQHGLDYPIEKVLPWFQNADLIHVSNEISFNPDCPYPDYNQMDLQFCSSPDYIQTLQDLGVNVVELTGNHMNDYGAEYLVQTIATYESLGWTYFGGGLNAGDAREPVKLEVNGNKIAFIGCNTEGPNQDWATDTMAGAAKCDMEYFTAQIAQLKAEGYVVVSTLQAHEIYTEYVYINYNAQDFLDPAIAGADIVSGSQSHTPMSFRFVGNSLIHYGLGNFLFDNMTYEGLDADIQREFIDRHIIYDGKYLTTELLTARLADWAQPNPMTAEDRADFLTEFFANGVWE